MKNKAIYILTISLLLIFTQVCYVYANLLPAVWKTTGNVTVDGVEYEWIDTNGVCYISVKNVNDATVLNVPSTVNNGSPVTVIRNFKKLTTVKEVLLPDTVTEIEAEAFSGCTSLEKINTPNNLKTINEKAFLNCSSLKEISFPEGLTFIGDNEVVY